MSPSANLELAQEAEAPEAFIAAFRYLESNLRKLDTQIISKKALVAGTFFSDFLIDDLQVCNNVLYSMIAL